MTSHDHDIQEFEEQKSNKTELNSDELKKKITVAF